MHQSSYLSPFGDNEEKAESLQFHPKQQEHSDMSGGGFLCAGGNFCGGLNTSSSLLSLQQQQQQQRFYQHQRFKNPTTIQSPLPTRNVSPKDVETIIATELQTSSKEELEHIYEDIHAVSQCIQETPEFVQCKIEQLQVELNDLKRGSSSLGNGKTAVVGCNSTAYELAESISYEYVHDVKFQLVFLRSTNYDCKLAAEKFLMYMEQKLALFGIDLLCEGITQDELDTYDKQALECGMFTKLRSMKDRAGRSICCLLFDLTSCESLQNMVSCDHMT